MRPSERIPRSLIRTMTDLFEFGSTTRTNVPKGSVGWQAVMAYMSNRSPLAVKWPFSTEPYHEAMPWSASVRGAMAAWGGASACGVALTIGDGEGASAAGLGSRASACTGGVESVTTTITSATDEAPARRQIPRGVFKLMLRDFLRITIPQFY